MGDELKPVSWRYDIQYGPEGETNYAWVYKGVEMIATMKTHHAVEVVETASALTALRDENERLRERLVAVAGPCSLGVGCEQYGVCYADAHGKPEECGKPSFACEALKDDRRIADHDKELWLSAEEKIEILRSENSRLQSELEDTAGLEKAAEEEVSVVEARATAAETEAATLRALLAEAEKALERIVCVTPDECFIENTAWELVECKPSGGGWIGAEDLRSARAVSAKIKEMTGE